MDYIKLVNNVHISIEDGGSIGELQHTDIDAAAAEAIVRSLTPKNVEHIEFYKEGLIEPYGIYDDMVLAFANIEVLENNVILHFGFRNKTDIEKRLEALEESQSIQDYAIDDLGVAVSELSEG